MENPLKPKAVLSLHVSSMKQSAQLVTAILKEVGFDVWVCYDNLLGGVEYRDEIDRNITKADVVIMMLNSHWANSVECKREFNVAQQAHFTNREINGNNRPVLLPLAFSDFNWFSEHPLLSRQDTTFICHDTENLLSGKVHETLAQLKEAATSALYQLIVPPTTTTITTNTEPSQNQLQPKFDFDLLGNLHGSTEAVETPTRAAPIATNSTGDVEYALALNYENGTGGKTQNMTKAAELFEKASSYGHIEATYKLGVCYDLGDGVEEDVAKAVKLYEKAASHGHLDSLYNLGVCYASGAGVKKDDQKAVQYYEKAAAKGQVNAMYNLGGCYKKGKGVRMDQQRAVELYERAASLGHMKAACVLGASYTKGTGVKKDSKKAIELYERASSQGVSAATYNLGLCYEQGRGVKKDKKKAIRLYETATGQGNLDSLCRLGYCYMNGKGVEKNTMRGADLYEKASSQGSAYGTYLLGMAYEKGTGKTKDTEKAKTLYTKAAAKGDPSARKRINKLSFSKHRQTEKFVTLSPPTSPVPSSVGGCASP